MSDTFNPVIQISRKPLGASAILVASEFGGFITKPIMAKVLMFCQENKYPETMAVVYNIAQFATTLNMKKLYPYLLSMQAPYESDNAFQEAAGLSFLLFPNLHQKQIAFLSV